MFMNQKRMYKESKENLLENQSVEIKSSESFKKYNNS